LNEQLLSALLLESFFFAGATSSFHLYNIECSATVSGVLLGKSLQGLRSEDLAVVLNDDDPNSVTAAEYHRHARGIPIMNFVHVRIPESPKNLTDARTVSEAATGNLGKD
jgi:hypothetical protein